jgi:hypothetical protein
MSPILFLYSYLVSSSLFDPVDFAAETERLRASLYETLPDVAKKAVPSTRKPSLQSYILDDSLWREVQSSFDWLETEASRTDIAILRSIGKDLDFTRYKDVITKFMELGTKLADNKEKVRKI